MLLSDVFDQLAVAEFSQHALGNPNGAGIRESDFATLTSHVNMGLAELHQRFPIKLAEVIVQQYEEIQRYELHSKFAVSNTGSTEPIKYIVDSDAFPFTDNIFNIEQVFNEIGEEVRLDDDHDELSVFRPSYNILQIPYAEDENQISVIYRAGHARLPIVDVDPTQLEVDIPPTHLLALLYFVSSRYFAPFPSLNGTSLSAEYFAKYTMACTELDKRGFSLSTSTTNLKARTNGWV